ncbi:AAA family ATPase [Methanobrevibacter arboriphilus]|uniref:AAA family ATPase n=1 Tax=Methanobrevibacter arboriphilus TaxID=39441 RepID=UPI0006D03139|nr:AAA family ATPase [Methanobrevibacter arboriphilus]
MLKLKDRRAGNIPKRVLIYGDPPGSGKSSYCNEYCRENNLKEIVIDFDSTNFTKSPVVNIDLSSDLKAYKGIKEVIKEVKNTEEYDTIVFDGVGTMLDLLISSANGMRRFADRSDRFNSILKELLSSDLSVIFIGQWDMSLDSYQDTTPPNKSIIRINSLVNWIYSCKRDGDTFTQTLIKFRKELEDNKTEKKSVSKESTDMVAGGDYLEQIKTNLNKPNPSKIEVLREYKEMKKSDSNLNDEMKDRILKLV